MLFAFSYPGELLLRIIENIRPLYHREEKEYLLPIFEEVYEEAKKVNPELKNIKMCISDQMHINAYAIGRHTVAVTKGAMETLDEEELKGFIGHEIGHIVNKDTMAHLFLYVGSSLFSLAILITRLFIIAADIVCSIMGGIISGIRSPLWFAVVKLFHLSVILWKIIFEFLLIALTFFINFLSSIESRENEYRADEYSSSIGFGHELIDALYLLEKTMLSGESTIAEKLQATHPNLAKRIANLESILNSEE